MSRWIAMAALVALPSVAAAQAPVGPQFRVNGYTFRRQSYPQVGVDSAGRFVVVWHRQSESYGGEGIYGQRFDDAGQPLGGEFRVNAAAYGVQHVDAAPGLAVRGDGGFVVAWPGELIGHQGLWARRFSPAGAPLAAEYRVNTATDGFQYDIGMAMDAAGNFLVVWTDSGADGSGSAVEARRFDAAGTPRGAVFRVNTTTTDFQRWPAVAMAPGGAFMVVWASFEQGGEAWEIWAQRFDAQGGPQAGEFHVNIMTSGNQWVPSAAADGAGNFIVTWEDRTFVGVRRYAPSGLPLGAEFRVGEGSTFFYPYGSTVAADADGRFVVVWNAYDFAAHADAPFAGLFDATGTPGPIVPVARAGTDERQHLAAAFLPGHGFVTAWRGLSYWGQPSGIFMRRFAEVGPDALLLDTTAGPSGDGNHILEPGEAVGVVPSWRNGTTAPRTAGGAATGMTGPGSPSLYTILDGAAAYGTLPAGGAASCAGTGNCFAVGVGNPATRPATHWDIRLREDLSAPGAQPAQAWPLHVGRSFTDVPPTNGYYRFIETLLHSGVTGGCATAAYCPQSPVTREQMAVFVLAAREAPGYAPPICHEGNNQDFDDVAFDSPYCPWISDLYDRQVVTGCGPRLYCPTAPVTREQMAVFALRTLDRFLDPPACTTPMFADVPATSPFCKWIEELARRGVVTGCGGGNYCPTAAVTREQMAVFLTATFGLTLYGP